MLSANIAYTFAIHSSGKIYMYWNMFCLHYIYYVHRPIT